MVRMTHSGVVAFVAGMVLTTSAIADLLTPEARQLAHCEGVYLYAAQVAQLSNNEGAALNILTRASRTTTASFFLNRRGDSVPGGIVREIKASRVGLKERLDSNPIFVSEELAKCDKAIPPIISSVANDARSETLWGKSYVELNQHMLDQYKKSLGL